MSKPFDWGSPLVPLLDSGRAFWVLYALVLVTGLFQVFFSWAPTRHAWEVFLCHYPCARQRTPLGRIAHFESSTWIGLHPLNTLLTVD